MVYCPAFEIDETDDKIFPFKYHATELEFIGNNVFSTIATDLNNRIVERIIVMGVPAAPSEIRVKSHTSTLDFQYNDESKVLVIRKPLVSALDQWTISIIP